MGLTITEIDVSVMGNKRVVTCNIAFDSSYPTGGESLPPSAVRLREVTMALIAGNSGYSFEYDYDNELLMAYYPSVEHLHTITLSGTHAGNAVELAANANDAALGEAGGTGYTGITGIQNASAAVADEVGNADNLSALTAVKAMFIGY